MESEVFSRHFEIVFWFDGYGWYTDWVKTRVSWVLSVAAILFVGAIVFMRFERKDSSISSSGIIAGSFDSSKQKTDAEWKTLLTAEQYHILREAGTEAPYTGALEHESRKGTYFSVGCDEPLFRSEQKFDSGTGWPSFWAPIKDDALVLKQDNSIAIESRTEVLDRCGGHLGHVFDDGPQPTGKRYCMNSAALYFVPDEKN